VGVDVVHVAGDSFASASASFIARIGAHAPAGPGR
jgi:hypothetical protein